MRKFSTPTLPITIQYKDKTPIDFEFDYLLFTIKNEGRCIEKQIPFSEVVDGKFNIEFTQEETGMLEDNTVYEIELNLMIGDRRIPTDIKRGKVLRNLHNEVIINE